MFDLPRKTREIRSNTCAPRARHDLGRLELLALLRARKFALIALIKVELRSSGEKIFYEYVKQ